MMRDPHRRTRRTISAHFASGANPTAERDMRHHLRDCADCLDFYDKQLLLGELDPAVPRAPERLARALGLPVGPARRGRPQVSFGFGFGMLAGAAALGTVLVVATARQGASGDEGGAPQA